MKNKLSGNDPELLDLMVKKDWTLWQQVITHPATKTETIEWMVDEFSKKFPTFPSLYTVIIFLSHPNTPEYIKEYLTAKNYCITRML